MNFKHANFSRRTPWEGSGGLEGQLFFESRRGEDPGPCFQKIFKKILVSDFGHLAPTWQKCNEKGLGRRGSHSFAYETMESGMRWAGGQGQS